MRARQAVISGVKIFVIFFFEISENFLPSQKHSPESQESHGKNGRRYEILTIQSLAKNVHIFVQWQRFLQRFSVLKLRIFEKTFLSFDS